MPQRIPAHIPSRIRTRDHKEVARPNAAQRGYCNKAWYATRQQVLVRDAWQCQICGRVCAEKREAQVDHIIPKVDGGSDDLSNLRCLCLSCHARKTLSENRSVC